MQKIGLIIIALLTLSYLIIVPHACTDKKGAKHLLEQNGFTEIKITEYKFFMCGKEDQFSTGFEAVSPTGQKVSGCVCSGIMKGKTIRFE